MIYVMTHKQFNTELTSFIPSKILYLGQGEIPDENWLDSRSGDSISEKNPGFSELTGIYWIWKNGKENEDDYVGVEHYRRYFLDKAYQMLHEDLLQMIFRKFDVIVPVRFPLVPEETVENQLSRIHSSMLTDAMKEVISSKYADYAPALERVLQEKSLHAFNMSVMKKPFFDRYCSWLFPILFDIEALLTAKTGKTPDNREIGYISERLMTVWLYYDNIAYYELPVLRLT